ncbi:uncharacterized protein V1516DRAFT_673912 [Lipomyces oligophaga]|uniref:uncharacterized protein n=1 Tax=Lipomyces oligophaga TaxID=45792 RepID=UPI0034CD1E73
MPMKQALTDASARPRFACRHCSSTFKRKEHMTRHERSHTAERPFECSFCETAFTRKDLLVRHKRTCVVANAAAAAAATANSNVVNSIADTGTKLDSHNVTNIKAENSIPLPSNVTGKQHRSNHRRRRRSNHHDFDSDLENNSDDLNDDALHLADEYDITHLSQYDHLIGNTDRDSINYDSISEECTESSNSLDWDSGLDESSQNSDPTGSPVTSWFDSLMASSAVFSDTTLRDLIWTLSFVCGGQNLSLSSLSTDTMNLFLSAYRKHSSATFPILHSSIYTLDYLPSAGFAPVDLQIALPAATNGIVLLFAASLGALFCSKLEFSRELRDAGETCLQLINTHQTELQRSEEALLGVMQARLLCGVFDAWSGDRCLVERALDEQAALVRACVNGISRHSLRLTSSFKEWTLRESFHRLYWGYYTFMSNLYLSFGDISPLPRIGTEKLPLPEADILWEEVDEKSWSELIVLSEPPATSDVTLARILAFNEVGGIIPIGGSKRSNDPSYSTFATCVILRILLHHLSSTNQVLKFGGLHSIPATIELDYLRKLSFEQVDRIVSHLSSQSLRQNLGERTTGSYYQPRHSQVEILIQMIKLRRLNLPATRRLGVLSRLVLDEDLELDLRETLENRCKRSTNVTKTLSGCLHYIQPYLFKPLHIDSIEELLCSWESLLCLIMWIRTIEINYSSGISVQPEEAAMIDDITRIITSRKNTYVKDITPSGQEKMYLTTQLAYTWCGVLRNQDMMMCTEQVRSFLENLIKKL